MLGNLRELCHVLPLVNQVVGFFVNEKSSSVEVRLCYEEQSLFEVKSFVKDLLGEGICEPLVSDGENFSPVLVFTEHGSD